MTRFTLFSSQLLPCCPPCGTVAIKTTALQVAVSTQWIGKKYGELFEYLIKQKDLLSVALYRQTSSDDLDCPNVLPARTEGKRSGRESVCFKRFGHVWIGFKCVLNGVVE